MTKPPQKRRPTILAVVIAVAASPGIVLGFWDGWQRGIVAAIAEAVLGGVAALFLWLNLAYGIGGALVELWRDFGGGREKRDKRPE